MVSAAAPPNGFLTLTDLCTGERRDRSNGCTSRKHLADGSDLIRMRDLDVSVVHGGHFPSFGKVRYRQLIDECLAQERRPGRHLQGR